MSRPWSLIWVNVLFGAWVAASPFALGFAGNLAVRWNNLAVGIAVVILTLANTRGFGLLRGVVVLLGAWLFMSPFVFGFSKALVSWNDLIMGLLILIGAVFLEAMRPTNAPAAEQQQ
jgi:hypothetical protein